MPKRNAAQVYQLGRRSRGSSPCPATWAGPSRGPRPSTGHTGSGRRRPARRCCCRRPRFAPRTGGGDRDRPRDPCLSCGRSCGVPFASTGPPQRAMTCGSHVVIMIRERGCRHYPRREGGASSSLSVSPLHSTPLRKSERASGQPTNQPHSPRLTSSSPLLPSDTRAAGRPGHSVNRRHGERPQERRRERAR